MEEAIPSSQVGMEEGVSITERHMEQLLEANADVLVRFSGLKRVDRRVVEKQVAAIVGTTTIGDAVREAEAATSTWVASGLFRSATFRLEPTLESSRGASRDVVVHFDVVEGRPKRSVGVFTSDAAIPELRVGLEHIFGGRYSVQGTYVPPASRLHSWSLAVSSLVPWLGKSAEYAIGARTEFKTLHPADAERVEEVKTTVRTDEGSFELGFQRRTMAARDSFRLPRDILRDFATHGKGYLRHEVHVDRTQKHHHPLLFDMYPLPVSGYEVSMVSELCGLFLGGTSCFHKWECTGTKYWPLGHYCSAQWSLKLGSVAPLTPHARIPLNDRLFLSHRHVRGYKSIGPSTFDVPTPPANGGGDKDAKDPSSLGRVTRFAATGGNALIASSLSINFPFVPYPNNGMLAMHAFVDGGALRSVRRAHELLDAKAWRASIHNSVGLGLVMTRIPLIGQVHNGRFELNVSAPLRWRGGSPFSLDLSPPDARIFDTLRFGLTWSSSVSM